MKITIEPKYSVGQMIFLRTDPDIKGHIVGIVITENNHYHYLTRFGIEDAAPYFELELTDEKDYTHTE